MNDFDSSVEGMEKTETTWGPWLNLSGTQNRTPQILSLEGKWKQNQFFVWQELIGRHEIGYRFRNGVPEPSHESY
jgi:hypothetical protein